MGCCEACGVLSTQVSYYSQKWGHLYFAPLIPIGSKVRVLRECSNCKKGGKISVAHVPRMIQVLQKKLEEVIVALGAGETHLDIKGQAVEIQEFVLANINELYYMGGQEEMKLLMGKIRSMGNARLTLLAEAKLGEVQGDLRYADDR